MKLEIKVCGNTRLENLEKVCSLQPEYVGFIFYDKSKRNVSNESLPLNTRTCKAKRVGVFVNAEEEEIRARVEEFKLDIIQLHGDETPEFTSKINMVRPVFKAFQIDKSFNYKLLNDYMSDTYKFLFDTKSVSYGGSGKKFDWSLLGGYKLNKPFILSGGIGPHDIENIKALSHPMLEGIDLNSQFETNPGVKNIEQLSTFITKIRE